MRLPDGPILIAAEMRAAETAAVTPDVSLYDLMERAGAAVAEAVWRFGGGRPTLILCGPGNNGGDGYVAARLLAARGVDVRVAALRPPRAPEAIEAASRWMGPVETLSDAAPAPVLVDALFGTGLARPLEDEVIAPLYRITRQAKFRIAVDLPSGFGTDDGAWLGGLFVDLTLALGSLKPCHLLQPAATHCGSVLIAHMGINAASNLTVNAVPPLASPGPYSHKYQRGMVVVQGGQMAGAGILAARGAMPLAGYVALIGARRTGPDALVHKRWDDLADDKRVGALLVGPGLGRGEDAKVKLHRALSSKFPLVLDADALAIANVDMLAKRNGQLILTPHEGEFVGLFGTLEGSKVERARAAAVRSDAVIVLKGADTVIAHPDGHATIQSCTPGWLASAGTGDVLAGIIAARLAATRNGFDAACDAVWIHAEAARLAGPGLIADDLPRHIPAAIASCL